MLSVIPAWLAVVGAVLITFRMVVSGFIVRRGLLSWPMFTGMCPIDIRGIDRDGRPLNQWDYFQHGDVNKSLEEVRVFLLFLESQKRVFDRVNVISYDENGVTKLVLIRSESGWA